MRFALALGAALTLALPSAAGVASPTNLGIGYICGAERGTPAPGGPDSMIAGVGAETFAVDTRNREAQAWFDEGVRLYHAFSHEEAKAAFAKAAAADPDCALCLWGVALGDGPTLNYGISPEQTAKALATTVRAEALVKPGDARARDLIAALKLRYTLAPAPAAAPAATPTKAADEKEAQQGAAAAKDAREKAFSAAMDALVRRYPADDGIAVVTVHSLLIPARDDDVSGVPRAEEILETVLARRPDDVAAIHYYIHATEIADHAARALPYAERLAGLAPGASHLVHMGSHTFFRVGQYERAALVNAAALQADAGLKSRAKRPGPLGTEFYYAHNFSFGMAGAMMAGDAPLAVKYAQHAALAFGPGAEPERGAAMRGRARIALGRYAPDQLLALAAPAASDPLILRLYDAYGRGEAFAAKGDPAAVARQAEALDALRAEAVKAKDDTRAQLAEIAGDVLQGRAAMLRGAPQAAARRFAAANATQLKAFPVLDNFDPPPFWYPARRSLAAADLKAGRYADAEREAQRSLGDWPHDPLALRVLAQAEARQGKAKASAADMAEARAGWRGDLSKVPLDLT